MTFFKEYYKRKLSYGILFEISIVFLIFFAGTTSVVLKDVKVPSMVRNATEPHVILDCIYSLNHSEKDGMILKWYFNGKTIFQWIPPSKPQVCYQY